MYAIVSIFTATENAAMTTEPKLFTTVCTIRIPRFITDCCKQVNPDSDKILRKFRLSHRISRRVSRNSPTPETYCAMAVASAAPIIPMPNGMTKSKSSPTFSATDTPRKISGRVEFPMPRSMLEM